MTRLTSGQRGFTMIELLIVIAIFAILVCIVALNVTEASGNVTLDTLQTETQLVQLAIDHYNAWDVQVNGNPAIPAQSSPTQVCGSSGTFGKYLTTPTRYYYRWGSGGVALDAAVALGQ